MSSGWWRGRSGARAPGPPAAADPWDPPATLLRIPPAFHAGTARRVTQRPLRPAVCRQCLLADGTVGTPVVRRGLVKVGKAQSVDLRHALLSPAWLPPKGFGRGALTPDPSPLGGRSVGGEDALPSPLGGRGVGGEGSSPDALPSPLGGRGVGGEGSLARHALALRLAVALQPPAECLLRHRGVLTWPAPFFPYQREGIQALLQSDRLLLADDMGLGKTVQVIAALRVLLLRREVERALVVVPASLMEQWRRELERWAPELRVMLIRGSMETRVWQWQYRAHVTLASYDTLRSDSTFSPRCGPSREVWGVVVLDEAQRIKNREAEISRICKRLPRERSWAATGTPLENRIEDVASILEFVTGAPEGGAVVPSSGAGLRAALSEVQLRRRKPDVLRDLPPKIVTELALPLTSAQRRAYVSAERQGIVALREAAAVRIEHVLALITRLKQICNFDPLSGASSKMADLSARLEELAAAGHRALVFTQYTGDHAGARRVAAGLRRFSPMLYTGDMGLAERADTVDRFEKRDDHRVLVLSLRAGGLGLNLHRASYVFHFDRWWNPAVENQAEDRAHRLGQTQPVHVYQYVMADTIEERVAQVLREKAHLFRELVDTTSLDLGRLLDKRDLFALVGLEAVDVGAPDLPGEALESRVASLLARRGFQCERTARVRDGGVDVVARGADAAGEPVRLFLQCKDTNRPAGVEVVRSLSGVLPEGDPAAVGVVVCPAGFTADARAFAGDRRIRLWDAAALEEIERGGRVE